jgi:hypothetical protein
VPLCIRSTAAQFSKRENDNGVLRHGPMASDKRPLHNLGEAYERIYMPVRSQVVLLDQKHPDIERWTVFDSVHVPLLEEPEEIAEAPADTAAEAADADAEPTEGAAVAAVLSESDAKKAALKVVRAAAAVQEKARVAAAKTATRAAAAAKAAVPAGPSLGAKRAAPNPERPAPRASRQKGAEEAKGADADYVLGK